MDFSDVVRIGPRLPEVEVSTSYGGVVFDQDHYRGHGAVLVRRDEAAR